MEPMIQVGNKNLATDEEIQPSTTATPCKPLLNGTETEEQVESLLMEGLQDLGYSAFRPGQVRKIAT